jgi:hypothetical protein
MCVCVCVCVLLRFVSPCIIVQFKQITNQMQQFSSLLSWRLFTAQHVSGLFPPIIRNLNDCSGSLWFYLRIVVTVVLRSWSGRLEPTRPRTQDDCHHDTKVKPETATAVIELLMMGGKAPETCWAVNKRQDSKLEKFCIWLVICLKYMCTFVGTNK